MKKIICFISILLSLSTQLFGSTEPRVSLLICGKGNDLYSIFGHSAIRIKCDTSDVVFNFGTFDTDTPNFGFKFIRGDLNYALSKDSFHAFFDEYVSESRSVTEYPILLNSTDALKLNNSLEAIYNNATERVYKYQFLTDNCSTRIYTLLQANSNSFNWPTNIYKTTFRESINISLNNSPVSRFGINILLGALGETQLNSTTNVFLPDSLVTELSEVSAQYSHQSMLGAPNILFDKQSKRSNSYLLEIIIVMALACIMIWSNFKSQAIINLAIGSLLIGLMLWSLRAEFKLNYTILIFNPIDILLVYKLGNYKGFILTSLLFNSLYILLYFFFKIDYPPLLVLNFFILLYKLKQYMIDTTVTGPKHRSYLEIIKN
ncbi:MAG: DUF4105 domain-containing protein [Mucilaginibacter sp.]|uniref:lipoprotein N-acyltransferase Lnb domain-containing protein n=1 Tax=Mucilaginibacter sp. TaxID=1882438 RepID=UPI0031B120B6